MREPEVHKHSLFIPLKIPNSQAEQQKTKNHGYSDLLENRFRMI